jgi:hypothetical protein
MITKTQGRKALAIRAQLTANGAPDTVTNHEAYGLAESHGVPSDRIKYTKGKHNGPVRLIDLAVYIARNGKEQ